ncbi:DUF4411 family protein [Adlercreutzia sp. ZJ473]|uniref:DUF4411 family protein n=1 Tax=Adlercreutzia sp. ZJ473 TaxID=2722822 RepID=UPI001556B3A2|nr:DUF4411 family protein [Adlercreutzia sp. ZJ473]
MNRYLLDSNYWINAGHHYPRDIFPSFWEEMESLVKSGGVVVHQTVLDELNRKDDEASAWMRSIGGYQVMPISEETFKKYLECCRWAEDPSRGYERGAIDEFEESGRADAWICAEACASGLTIVTDEKPSNSAKKIKIPDVCAAFGVSCISNFAFMRNEGFSF